MPPRWANAIARTETHAAATYGSDEVAKASGLQYTRIWVSAGDARVRPDHAAAHGQRRRPNEPFSVGGYSMMRPGVGPASQVVSCRCVVRYEFPTGTADPPWMKTGHNLQP